MNNNLEDYEYVEEVFNDIVKDIKEADIKIPCIDSIITFNDKTITIMVFDKFFAIYESLQVQVDEIEEPVNKLFPMGLGRHNGNGDLTLVRRYKELVNSGIFKEGIDAFIDFIEKTRMEELPPTILNIDETMDFQDIVESLALKYLQSPEKVILH